MPAARNSAPGPPQGGSAAAAPQGSSSVIAADSHTLHIATIHVVRSGTTRQLGAQQLLLSRPM
eukprot:COSAG01_NODE_10883_length_2061_cov_1.871050_4_plen_63_part_00